MIILVKKDVIVAVYAHPDDGEFLAAGTLARWVEEGNKEVYAICATNGDLGTKTLEISSEKLTQVRQTELKKAMEVIGANPPIFLNYPDGFLRNHTEELKEKLVYWFRKLKADLIITFDPWKMYEIHPDHIEAGRIASEAAVFSCFPLLYPSHLEEGLEPYQPQEVWYMAPFEHKANKLVDIASTMQKKIEAVLCHHSQVAMLADMFIPGADPRSLTSEQLNQLDEATGNFLRLIAQGMGSLSSGQIEFAEAFYAIKVGPGHFDNYQEMLQEAIGMFNDDIEII